MKNNTYPPTACNRRDFLSTVAAASSGAWTHRVVKADERKPSDPPAKKAQIAITLDLEMSRNFPNWKDTHWDYEKGNLNQPAKDYTVQACRRVKDRGGLIHTFVVGQVFEQEDVGWLEEIAREGHPIGNHTYDHIYLLASSKERLQYRFARAPWLIANRPIPEIIRDNIALTNMALEQRIGVKVNGFRTPGGFSTALHGRRDLQDLLLSLGFDWISCKYPRHPGIVDLKGSGEEPSQEAFDNILAAQSEAQPFRYPSGLIEIPMSPISDIWAFRNGRWQLRDFLKAVRVAMECVIERGAVFDFLAHPSCLGVVDPGFQAIDLICDLVDQTGDRAEIVPLDAIAKKWPI